MLRDPHTLSDGTRNDSDAPNESNGRYGAHRTLHAVNFVCNAPEAMVVSLVGDFNRWNPTAHPMCRTPDGAWFITVELHHGHHRYAFLVDGQLTLDPQAQGIAHNDAGERLSLRPVS